MTMVTSDLIDVYVNSDALDLAKLVRTGAVSPSELAETAISIVETLNPTLNAVTIKAFDVGREMAKAVPQEGVFAGVPFLLKDMGSFFKGLPLTHGMAYRQNFICQADSALTSRIRSAGLVILGRTNVPENGWSIGTESPLHGPAINPWNASVTPGGSSGGSAVAVASGMVAMAEGTDGGGSIRVPASCCGLVGLKPSRGRITYGPDAVDVLFGSVYSFCLTRTVRDTAAFLDATAGTIPGDPYTPPTPATGWLDGIAASPRTLHVGFTLKSPWGASFAPEVAAAVEQTAQLLEELGHEVTQYDMTTNIEAAWYDYNQLVAVFFARDFEDLAETIGRSVTANDLTQFNWAQVVRGRSISATDHMGHFNRMRSAVRSIATELAPFDAFLTPTLTQLPRPLGYWHMNEPNFDAYNARWSDAAFMGAFNISGLPAISIPAGWANDVPIGIQFVGRYGDEATILSLAAQCESARPWITRHPGIWAGSIGAHT